MKTEAGGWAETASYTDCEVCAAKGKVKIEQTPPFQECGRGVRVLEIGRIQHVVDVMVWMLSLKTN